MAKNKDRSLTIKKNNKKALLVWGSVIAVTVLALTGYFALNQNILTDLFKKPSTEQVMNLDPPTETDRQEAEQNKERLSQTKETQEADIPSGDTPQTPSNKKNIKPTITEATRTSIRGYITGIFEEGGTCTATFVKDSQTLTKSSTGFQNASYTQCEPMDLPGGFLETGKWSVTLSYSSGLSEGESDKQYIE
jgi:hypothetical protein